jgi:phytanoyl-CoA hydroxylase
MRILTKEQLEEYHENGYLILRNFINVKYINEFSDFVAHVISLEAKSILAEKQYSKEQILNELLIKIKKLNPSSSSWIYQTVLNSYYLKEFFINIDLSPVVMELLEIADKKNLGTVSPAFRFDIPGDTKNIRTWHQDSNYFLENEKGSEHLVTWIPLNKAVKENGSVIIAPKTHTSGRLERTHEEGLGLKSEQYTSLEKYYRDMPKEYIEANPGDIAFINMDLLHSSGVNITNDSVRYTAQIRFSTINRDSYRPVWLKPEYPNYERLAALKKK